MDANSTRSGSIPPQECLSLVASGRLGRLAFSHHAMPALVAMTYIVDGRDLVLQTASGPALSAARGEGSIVAFSVDEIDPVTAAGWSVMMTGQLRQVTETARVRSYQGDPALAWPSGDPRHFLLLTPGLVSGRWFPADSSPLHCWAAPSV
jgi:hypothetical protein